MDQAAVDLITKLISSVGFPIFVAVWLLFRTDRLLKDLIDAVQKLTQEINRRHDGG